MRTVGGRTDHVVVVGAGLGRVCPRRCIWPGAAARSPSWSATPFPAAGSGRVDIGGYRLDTGPTVLTMPDIIDDAFAAVGETLTDRLDLLPVDPAYRAMFADGSALDVHTDARRDGRRGRGFAGRRRGRRATCSCATG